MFDSKSIRSYIRINNATKLAGQTWAVLFVLSLVTLLHFDAHSRMELAHRHFAIMDDKTISEMKIIDFLHDNYWIAIAYGVTYLGFMLSLVRRNQPRWIIWGTFLLLMQPALPYMAICFKIGGKFIAWQ